MKMSQELHIVKTRSRMRSWMRIWMTQGQRIMRRKINQTMKRKKKKDIRSISTRVIMTNKKIINKSRNKMIQMMSLIMKMNMMIMILIRIYKMSLMINLVSLRTISQKYLIINKELKTSVNNLNRVAWFMINPQFIRKVRLHRRSLTVFCIIHLV